MTVTMTSPQLFLAMVAVLAIVLRWSAAEIDRVAAMRRLLAAQRERDTLHTVVAALQRDIQRLHEHARELEGERMNRRTQERWERGEA